VGSLLPLKSALSREFRSLIVEANRLRSTKVRNHVCISRHKDLASSAVSLMLSVLLHVHLSGELGATLDCTFAEAPCVGFFDRLVLGGSTEDAFGLLVLLVREKDPVAPFSSLRTSRSVANAAPTQCLVDFSKNSSSAPLVTIDSEMVFHLRVSS